MLNPLDNFEEIVRKVGEKPVVFIHNNMQITALNDKT